MNRLQNLLMIPVTMYLMRYTVILPVIKVYGFEFQQNNYTFFCLALSLICMSAAGYAINDYFNPSTTLSKGEGIASKKIVLYITLCASGILLGGYVVWKAGMMNLILVYVLAAAALWMYSAFYRRQILIGYIVIAMLSALVPISVLLDIQLIYSFYRQFAINFNFALFWIIGVSVFIFVTMFLYEMIKDIEEFESNINYDWKTLPFVMGDRFTKQVIIGVNAAIIAMLCLAYSKYEVFFAHVSKYLSFLYILLLLIIPLLYISWKVYKATTGDDYRRAGNIMKIVWLAGVSYSSFFF